MSTPAVALPIAGERRRSPSLRRFAREYSFAFALGLSLALLIANVIAQPDFGWKDQLATFAPLAVAAMASTPSIISGRGGFDLTISPLMTFISVLFVTWLIPAGLGGAVAVPILLLIGAAIGALNGILIVGLRVPPMVVTLSTYFVFIGLDLKLVDTPKTVDHSWTQHLAHDVGPIPGALFTIGLPLLIWFGLGRLPWRSALFAVGSNDATAYSSGVNVNLVRVGAYALGGLFAAVGAFALTGLVSSVDSSQASAYTLVAIAGVALGGTPLTGGRGGILGSLLGASVIYLVESLLSALQINTTWLQIVYGAALLIAVVASARLTNVNVKEGK
jgi:ribose transport system permease protein